jgi:aspartokinase-like uncharacterized kinase
MGPLDASQPPLIVKVGGSLYDLPDLGPRLRGWLAGLGTRHILLVPGGGAAADLVRKLDSVHGLGEEAAHWLALRSLSLTAHFLAGLVPGAAVVPHPGDCQAVWAECRPAVLDSHAFALADEGQPGSLPHAWSVTSDSLAARAAHVAEARCLILLKSITFPSGHWHEAGRRGWVDASFAEAIGENVEVRIVNLREWTP